MLRRVFFRIWGVCFLPWAAWVISVIERISLYSPTCLVVPVPLGNHSRRITSPGLRWVPELETIAWSTYLRLYRSIWVSFLGCSHVISFSYILHTYWCCSVTGCSRTICTFSSKGLTADFPFRFCWVFAISLPNFLSIVWLHSAATLVLCYSSGFSASLLSTELISASGGI